MEEKTPEQREYERMMAPYRARAASFVEKRYPNDPAMLLAAATLTKDQDDGAGAVEAGLRSRRRGAGVGRLHWEASGRRSGIRSGGNDGRVPVHPQ